MINQESISNFQMLEQKNIKLIFISTNKESNWSIETGAAKGFLGHWVKQPPNKFEDSVVGAPNYFWWDTFKFSFFILSR